MKKVYLTNFNYAESDSRLPWWKFQLLILFLALFFLGNRVVLAQGQRGSTTNPGTTADKFSIDSFSPISGCPGTVINVVPKNTNSKGTQFNSQAIYDVTFTAKANGITVSATVSATYVSASLLKVKLPKLVRSNNVEIATNSLLNITVTQTLNGLSVSDTKQNAFTYQVDNVQPQFTSVAAAITINMDPGQCSAALALTAPAATDDCSEATVSSNLTALQLQQAGGKVIFPGGTTTIVWTATDGSGNTATTSQTVTVSDKQQPVITAPASIPGAVADAGLCSAVINLGSPVVSDNCGIASVAGIRSDAKALTDAFPVGTTTITYTVTDINHLSAQAEQTVTVMDREKPVISGMPDNISVTNDAAMCAATVSWQIPQAADNCSIASFTSNFNSGSVFYEGTHTVIYTAVDASGNQAQASFTITVTNIAPAVTGISAPVESVLIGSAAAVSISFADNNLAGATLTWGDGTHSYYGTDNITNSPNMLTLNGNLILGSHIYAAPGLYRLSVTLTDACNATTPAAVEYEYIIVYDPNSGFVSGGGWINSGVNTKYQYMQAAGKANFGFKAAYKEASVVDGHTNFQFSAGNMHLKSASHDKMRLIISGNTVNYKGEGTINNAGNYGFLLSAVDGQFDGGTGRDKVRMVIWEIATGKVVYDNQDGAKEDAATSTAIDGGSIVIHKPAAQKNARVEAATIAEKETAQVNAYPNPFEDRVTIDFGKVLTQDVVVTVVDQKGAAVYQQTFKASNAAQIELDLSNLHPGIHFLQAVHGTDRKLTKIVKF